MSFAQEAVIQAREGVEGDIITDSPRYHAAIVRELLARGFCAFFDGEEIALKRVNAFSEQWDMERANGRVLRMYAATCRPAWSAIPSGPVPSPSPTPCPSPEPCHTETGPPGCEKCEDIWSWMLARGHWTPVPGRPDRVYNDPANDPNAREFFDRDCNRRRQIDGPITNRAEDWFPNICRSVTVCPSPAPCASPTPPPAPGSCPALTCVHIAMTNIQGPDHLPRPAPVVGGYVVLDGSPLWVYCSSAGRCDDECNAVPYPGCRAVCGGRECRPPAGLRWRLISGPNVPTETRTQRYDLCPDAEPMDGRGYHFRLGPLAPGTYTVEADTHGAKDCTGATLPGYGSGRFTFTVAP